MPQATPTDIIKGACSLLISRAGPRRQFKKCRDAAQELHDHIDDLLQDRDPKGQREEERSNPVLALPAVSEQTTASVNVIQEVADEEGQPAIQPNVAADTTSQGGDQTEVDEPADSDNTAPGPVAEGDVAAEQSQDMDTSRSAESKGDLNDSVVDDYIQEEAAPEKGVLYSTDVEEQGGTVEESVVENYVKAQSGPHLPDRIPDRASQALLHVLRLAVATEKAAFIIVALSTIQQMVAAGYIQGEANSLVLEGEMFSGNEGGVAARGMSKTPENLGVAAQVLHLVCTCEEYCNDDEIELAVLRTMLTIVTSMAIAVHGMVLLLIIRGCYNIFIMSRNDANQQAAKGCLTQIIHIVFQRLIVGDSGPIRPITPPDLVSISNMRDARKDASMAHQIVASVWESVMPAEGAVRPVFPEEEYAMPDDSRSEASVATSPAPAPPQQQGAIDLAEMNIDGGVPSAAPSVNGTAPPSKNGSASSLCTAVGPSGSAMSMTAKARTKLLQGAVKVMRALCKLSMRTSNTPGDASVTRGRVLAMELIAIVLINHQQQFREYPQLMQVVKGDLGNCLLANCKSSSSMLQRLTCEVFVVVLLAFREEIKAKVAYLFRHTILKGLDPPGEFKNVPIEYRFVAFACLEPVCADGQLLMDLYVNYDCDPDRSDTVLLERMFKGLINTINNPESLQDATAAQPMTTLQRNELRYRALGCVTGMLRAFFQWHSTMSGLQDPGGQDLGETINATEPGEPVDMQDAPVSSTAAAHLLDKKQRQRLKAEGIELFNQKPKKGIALLQSHGLVSHDPVEVAHFLKQTAGLDYAMMGDYLSDPSENCKLVMHAYIDAMDFSGLKFDDAIRMFLLDFRLPGEAQKIDRLMEKFAERYHVCNSNSEGYPFANAATAYVLSYSVIMLNTDQHNPTIKKRMALEDFIKNNRGIDDGRDIDRGFLEELYTRIKTNQIMMRHTMMENADGEGEEANTSTSAFDADAVMQNIFALFGRTKALKVEPSEQQIAELSNFLKEKTQGLTFYSASHPDELRPLMQSVWEYVLPTLSQAFSSAGVDATAWSECIQGLAEAGCVTAVLGFRFISSAFIRAIANFTSLHEPQLMSMQNAHALRQLLQVPQRIGSHLHENWIVILRCLSRWALVTQLASGTPTDLSLFSSVDPQQKHDLKKSWWQGVRARRSSDGSPKPPMQPGTLIDAGLSLGDNFMDRAPNPGVMDAVEEDLLSRVFEVSDSLDSEAIIEFFHALTTVSLEELSGKPNPRVFLLSKIVEACHHNMMRPRIVWTTLWKGVQDAADPQPQAAVWQGLSAYFVEIGCHGNLQVAMYAMDALRQVAEKFLERDELASMSFQNDFLTPFVVVMRQSAAKEIRELIIRQASRMVLSRVTNIKSGWKSMFMVFSQAAKDPEPTIVRLAFDTMEKIVREHFTVITETDVGVFADCVNCLTCFTNQSHDDNVALNAIAFLRFCAIRLAEGSIGDVDNLPEEVDMTTTRSEVTRFKQIGGEETESNGAEGFSAILSPTHGRRSSIGSGGRKFSDHEEHLYFWMPLLIGLTELTFDPRSAVRRSALDVLFDILTEHGACYSEGFWDKVFERMLLPIFDSVQMDDIDFATFSNKEAAQEEEQSDRWLYETCSVCLDHLIDLVVKFYPLVYKQLPAVLLKIKSFMLRTHHSLACVGVTAMEKVITKTSPKMDAAMWQATTQGIRDVARETTPDLRKVVTYSQTRYFRGDMPPAPDEEGKSRVQYSLKEGLGSRRLKQATVRAHVQSLLVQSCMSVFQQHKSIMPPEAIRFLRESVSEICHNARQVNVDHETKQLLMQWQAQDGVDASKTGLQDPPLLALEVEAAKAELTILKQIFADSKADAQAEEGSALLKSCVDSLARFESPQSMAFTNGHQDPKPVSRESSPMAGESGDAGTIEQEAMVDVVISALGTLGEFPDDVFKTHMKEIFPLMTRLIKCRAATVEMQVALSNLFAAKLGPV